VISNLERSVLQPLLFRPSLLESSDLRDADFSAGHFREAFSALVAMWEESRPAEIDSAILAERIGGNGAVAFVGSLMDGNVRVDIEAFRNRVSELRKRTVLGRIEARARAGLRGIDDIRSDLEAYEQLDKPSASPSDFLIPGSTLQELDIAVEWTIERLLPARSLTLLHSCGGLGKTWLSLAAAKAISAGTPFLGLSTKARPVVYCDFENPLPLLVERIRKLDIRDVVFWHLGASTRPPKLDGPDWELYKKAIQPGSLVIFDTLRAAHDGDENSSQDAALVMGRLKELRENGLEIVAQHHTGKADERVYRGSTAFSDLADHVLDFHRVRRGSLEEIDEDTCDPDALFSLGTGKTRFAPARFYLAFDPDTGNFMPAQDPKTSTLDAIAEYITGPGVGQNQSSLVAWVKEELGIKKRDTILALLKRGEGERWRSSRGFRGVRTYEPI